MDQSQVLDFYTDAYISHCQRRKGAIKATHDDLERQYDVVFDLSLHCPLLAIVIGENVLKRGYPSASSEMVCGQLLVHAISGILTDAEREIALELFRNSSELRWAAENLWENGLTEEGHAFLRRVRQFVDPC